LYLSLEGVTLFESKQQYFAKINTKKIINYLYKFKDEKYEMHL